MNENSIRKVSGKGVYVKGNDIDTDRIIPARFLKCVTFDELGASLFYDVRFNEDGSSKHHVLDQPEYSGAEILVSDVNFGCGSSREHAPQAIQKFGFRAIIAGSFAEIFHGNCTTLGMPCIVMQDTDREKIAAALQEDSNTSIIVDLENLQVICANQIYNVSMKESAREAFLAGTTDPLDTLLAQRDSIDAVARKLGYA
jgi:3-isopropylmalate/(R)-2-methylmalate dehydratase small subunit